MRKRVLDVPRLFPIIHQWDCKTADHGIFLEREEGGFRRARLLSRVAINQDKENNLVKHTVKLPDENVRHQEVQNQAKVKNQEETTHKDTANGGQ